MARVAAAGWMTAEPVASETVISAAGLAVARDGRRILSDVTLGVRGGERLALVGQNGAGKTSLLRVLAGLDRPSEGHIEWCGQRLPTGSERTRMLGVLFQAEAPVGFTVRELITLGLGLDGPPSSRQSNLVDAAMGRMELRELADRRCNALSGGEWQRVALARALVAEPRIVVLDEPTNHLDPAHRAELLAVLDSIRGTVAVVIATHDLECAASCDRIAMLSAGTLAAIGSPGEILRPDVLQRTLGVQVRCVPDPHGGPPLLRLLGRQPGYK